jgi:hypothetical protein
MRKILPDVLFWVAWYAVAYLAMRWLYLWVAGDVCWPESFLGGMIVTMVGVAGLLMASMGIVDGAIAFDQWQWYRYGDINAPIRERPYAALVETVFSEETIARWKALNPHRPERSGFGYPGVGSGKHHV